MGRLIDSRSVGFGNVLNWNGTKLTSLNNSSVYYDLFFVDYIKSLFDSNFGFLLGLLYGNIVISHSLQSVNLYISIYDGPFEEWMNSLKLDQKGVVNYLKQSDVFYVQKGKLALLEKVIIESGQKYFKKPVVVFFTFLDVKNVSSDLISRYLSVKLKQGYSLEELLVNVQGLLNNFLKEKTFGLIGYGIDCRGRFTRKQRTSFKSVKEGGVSFNSVSQFVDFGCSDVILKYGKCNVKVWLSGDYDTFINYTYKMGV